MQAWVTVCDGMLSGNPAPSDACWFRQQDHKRWRFLNTITTCCHKYQRIVFSENYKEIRQNFDCRKSSSKQTINEKKSHLIKSSDMRISSGQTSVWNHKSPSQVRLGSVTITGCPYNLTHLVKRFKQMKNFKAFYFFLHSHGVLIVKTKAFYFDLQPSGSN